ncbi:hypothetical protein [Nocardia brasiliensis]|uniref:hypothetical protein n=1 Tax=Nocardia brasiliensis TaxID=37326 RepID=UPI0024548BCE|nr:hypothetical protein [Nocardia brasiliensis]
MTAPESNSDTNSSGYFRTESLVPPRGASVGLIQFIAEADSEIRIAFELLGAGTTSPPPDVAAALISVPPTELGSGAATAEYQRFRATLDEQGSALLSMDRTVADATGVVADRQQRALRAMAAIVADLNADLRRFDSVRISPAVESQLLPRIAAGVAAVYDQLVAATEFNRQVAYGSGAHPGIPGAAGTTPAPSGSSIRMDDLMSMLPILAMLPALAAPFIPLIPQLLEQHQENIEAAEEERERAEAAPTAGAPVPGDQPAAATVAAEQTAPTDSDAGTSTEDQSSAG